MDAAKQNGSRLGLGKWSGMGLALRLLAVCALSSWSLAASAHNHEPLNLDQVAEAFGWDFESAEIKVEKLSDGFYVFFGVGGNIGVSVGANGTLIVDDQFPQMQSRIEAALNKIGGDGVDFAINTHWHFDHADGNLALGPKGTWLVSQANSRAMMVDDHMINLVILKYLQKAYPDSAKPVITFDDRMQFHFNGEQIDLMHFGPAHTTGDTVAIFRGTNAVHFGDVYNAGYPFIDADNGGELTGMIAFCRSVLSEIDDATRVIPGHGPVSNKAGLLAYITMLETMRDRFNKMIDEGADLDAVKAANLTADFDEQYGDPTIFVDRAFVSLSKERDQ